MAPAVEEFSSEKWKKSFWSLLGRPEFHLQNRCGSGQFHERERAAAFSGPERERRHAEQRKWREREGERERSEGNTLPLPLICKTWYRFGDYLGLSKSISGKHDIRHPLNLSQKLVGLLISFKQGRRSKDGKMKSKWQISSVSFLCRYLDLQNLLIFVILRHL